MVRGRLLTVAAAVCAFVGVVAIGAFAIVSVAPREKPIAVAKDALLMESAPSPRRDEPISAYPQAPISEPAPLPRLEEVDRGAASLESAGRTQGAPEKPAGIPSAAEPAPPAQRKPARQTLAALPPNTTRVPDLAPPPVRVPAPPQERRIEGVMSASDIRRLRLSLRLTREQMPYWPPVEQALLEIGVQQAALARAGQDPKNAFGFGSAMHIFSVARPLLDVLREDQKAMIRERARTMGFGSIASSI
ncbi:hypothetical protein [Methylobacterium brachythecii]|uniref:Uncharacterized protein n=1 Tax=Methylobacterium brachythecii TaxID=1176177 RepID=A0A7W6AIS1_9HYPH|nr:hypothetical protein [Methylobacterium brachythecii]MBB3902364.1 hypothetical protein [Methylobacterium brachythecii]GLS42212.1 hypothetical protein GCM10007884_01970 [Methylobacterium brachythecii]